MCLTINQRIILSDEVSSLYMYYYVVSVGTYVHNILNDSSDNLCKTNFSQIASFTYFLARSISDNLDYNRTGKYPYL